MNGLKINAMIYNLCKDYVDMEMERHHTNYNSNMISRVKTQKFILLIRFLILIAIYLTLSKRLDLILLSEFLQLVKVSVG